MFTDHYYLALYQMREDGEHHYGDHPVATVGRIILPESDDDIRARCHEAADTLADWLCANREKFERSKDLAGA